MLPESAPWPIGDTDFFTGDGEGGLRIKALREEFKERYMVGFFSTPEEAATEVMAAIFRTEFSEQLAVDARAASPVIAAPTPHDATRARPREGFPNLWTPGDVLRVRFLDGAEELVHRVAEVGAEWSRYANLSFEFGDDPDAEVRISFQQPGSWSYTGTDCLNTDLTEPTMNFGWLLRETPGDEVSRAVLHEFGHLLGLLHEHQNPSRPDLWNKEAVREYYAGPPNNWTAEQVEQLVFKTWSPDLFPFPKPFDPDSIMVFPIPNEFTAGDFEIGWNRRLSQGDIEFSSKLYPFE